MKQIKHLILFSVLFTVNTSFAQPHKTIKKIKPYKWMVGLSWSIIDDDGRGLEHHFNFAETWNLQPYPTSIMLNRYFDFGLSAEVNISGMIYSNAKVINGSTGSGGLFLSADLNCKYNFQYFYFPKAKWLDPFVSLGVGYTMRNNINTLPHVLTMNVGGGVNFWLYKGFGITLNTNLKWGVAPTPFFSNGNYIQHNAGIVYRFSGGAKNNSSFSKKKYPWTHQNKKFKQNKDGH